MRVRVDNSKYSQKENGWLRKTLRTMTWIVCDYSGIKYFPCKIMFCIVLMNNNNFYL